MNTGRVIQTTRPPFLLLSLFCCLLAFSIASHSGYELAPLHLMLILVAALAAHISVNTLNEYQDFTSGLDHLTDRTPFSGGSGILPANPELARKVLWLFLGAILITIACGLYLVYLSGLELLWFGVIGIILVIAYTRWINRMPWLCLIAPGVGFGLVMVGGSILSLTGNFNKLAWAAVWMVFFLVNNLLLLNQYPDTHADRKSGRNHFPIHYGVNASNIAYLGFLLCAFAAPVYLVMVMAYTPWILTLVLLLLPGLYAYIGAVRMGQGIGHEPKFLAANVIVVLATPALFAVLLLLDAELA